jgi:uncharacterized protein YecT (DUF1311 family)
MCVSISLKATELSPEALEACHQAGKLRISELHQIERRAYRLSLKRSELFAVWQVAESLSTSPLYGQNRNQLVLQLVCLENAPIREKNTVILQRARLWKNQENRPFNFCDFVTRGAGGQLCVLRKANIDNRHYLSKLKRIINPLASRYRRQAMMAYYSSLNFFTLRTELEASPQTSSEAVWQISNIQNYKQGYLLRLKQIRQKKISPSLRAWSEVDRELNRLFRQVKVQLNLDPIRVRQHVVNFNGVKKVHQAWLSYRQNNALLFNRLDRRLSVRQWKILLTEQRIKELKIILTYKNY